MTLTREQPIDPRCEYCNAPVKAKRTWQGYSAPRSCSAPCKSRIVAWDRWVRDGRNVRKPFKALPSMPKPEAVAAFEVRELEVAA